jgi:psiF repeat
MKKLLITACLAIAAFAPGLAGAETAQQQKMKDCNTQATAKQMTGEARKTFMSQCLKAGGSPQQAAGGQQLTAQQQKMKDCNAQAKQQQLKGKDHKTFMSTCLSGKTGM